MKLWVATLASDNKDLEERGIIEDKQTFYNDKGINVKWNNHDLKSMCPITQIQNI